MTEKLRIFTYIVISALLYFIGITIHYLIAVVIGGFVGIISFEITNNILDGNTILSRFLRLVPALLITCLTSFFLVLYCNMIEQAKICERNPIFLSLIPLIGAFGLWLASEITKIRPSGE